MISLLVSFVPKKLLEKRRKGREEILIKRKSKEENVETAKRFYKL